MSSEAEDASGSGIELGRDLVEGVAARADPPIDDQTVEAARTLAERADLEHPINGPAKGIAAGALYLASLLCDVTLSQRQVAEAADVCERTVHNYYEAIADHEGESAIDGRYDAERWNELQDDLLGGQDGDSA